MVHIIQPLILISIAAIFGFLAGYHFLYDTFDEPERGGRPLLCIGGAIAFFIARLFYFHVYYSIDEKTGSVLRKIDWKLTRFFRVSNPEDFCFPLSDKEIGLLLIFAIAFVLIGIGWRIIGETRPARKRPDNQP